MPWSNWYILGGTNNAVTNLLQGRKQPGQRRLPLRRPVCREPLYLVNCTTHNNNMDGFFFDNTASGGEGLYVLTGCTAVRTAW